MKAPQLWNLLRAQNISHTHHHYRQHMISIRSNPNHSISAVIAHRRTFPNLFSHRQCQHIHHHPVRQYTTPGKAPKGRPTEILMRSATEDSTKSIKSLSFGEMLNHTRTAHHNQKPESSSRLKLMNAEQLLIATAEFSRHELTPRIARQIMSLKNLPYGVSDTESIGLLALLLCTLFI